MNEAPKTAAEFYRLLASLGKQGLEYLGLDPAVAEEFKVMVDNTSDADLNMLDKRPPPTSQEIHKLLWDLVGDKPKTWEELYAALKTRIDAPHAAVNKPYILGKGGLDDARKDHNNPKAPSF